MSKSPSRSPQNVEDSGIAADIGVAFVRGTVWLLGVRVVIVRRAFLLLYLQQAPDDYADSRHASDSDDPAQHDPSLRRDARSTRAMLCFLRRRRKVSST